MLTMLNILIKSIVVVGIYGKIDINQNALSQRIISIH
jgi:hypothetical protein